MCRGALVGACLLPELDHPALEDLRVLDRGEEDPGPAGEVWIGLLDLRDQLLADTRRAAGVRGVHPGTARTSSGVSLSGSPATVKTWAGPVSNDAALTFQQSIGANEALRTGSYAKTLTYTLSTTTP
jgi:hypothetical protein